MSDGEHTTNWPDLAIGLYDRLTGRNAEITYEFQDMHVKIPSGTAPRAACRVDFLGQAERPHAERGRRPKLEVTGRLEGTFRDRPVQLEAGGRELTLRVPNLRSAWTLRRAATPSAVPLMRAMRNSGLTLTLLIASRWAFPVLPEPHVAGTASLLPFMKFPPN